LKVESLPDNLQSQRFGAQPSNLQPSTFNLQFKPLGINLGKSKVTPLEEAAADYLGSFRLLKDLGDYFVVNVSSPNTPGLRSLQDALKLSQIVETCNRKIRDKSQF
jgi:dihydroorotate dehydrogenase